MSEKFIETITTLYATKGIDEAFEEIKKHIFPLRLGGHIYHGPDYTTRYETSELKEIIFARLPKQLLTKYLKENKALKDISFEFGKPLTYDDKINLCAQPLYTINRNFKPTKEKINKLKVLEDYMKNILCSGKQECYNFLLKWIANVVQGNKNNSCLYLKGPQGSGKSTLFHFLSNYVIGPKLCLETGSDPVRTKFNEILGGKLLVSIEELENFSKAEWESISSTLKRMITSNNIVLQDKGTKAHSTNNINNYILCSNNDAIKDDDGRRYFILDIDPSKIGNHNYYKNLYDTIMNAEVGEAFFQFMIKLKLEDFNPQDFPLTQSKIESINKRLDSVARFIKDCYVLTKKDINTTCKDLHEEYLYTYRGKQMIALDFHRKLSEFGFVRFKKGNKLTYNIPYKTIYDIAEKRHWLNEFDTFIDHKEPRAQTPDEEGPIEEEI